MATTAAAVETGDAAVGISTKEEAAAAPADPLANLPGGVNPLDFLYKLATQRSLQPPEFKQVTEQGPAHMKTFVWHCSFNNLVAQGSGRSKKEAKIAAAKAIRDNLDYASLPPPTNPLGGGPAGGPAGLKRKIPRPQDGFGTKKMRQKWQPPGPPMGMGFGPMMGPPMCGPPMGGFGGPPGFFRGNMLPFGVGPAPGTQGPALGSQGPAPIDPKGEDPFDNGSEDKDEAKEENGAEGENGGGGGGPTREEFMSPSFGGFYKDEDDVSAFEGSDGLKRSMMMADYQSRINRGYRSRLSKLDRHVIRKHKEIYPQESDLASILSLVTRTEESLKQVAESLNTKEVKKISGMVRVGDLSKGLLLASDRVVDLVLLTKRPPTVALRAEVEVTLQQKLKQFQAASEDQDKSEGSAVKEELVKEEASADNGNGAKEEAEEESPLDVTTFDSGVVVTCGLYSVRVTLASTAVSIKEEAEDNTTADDGVLLSKEAGTKALTELRHSKWFAVTAANLPSCVECIRVVKDLCIRDPAWSVLSGWAVELLVERALYTAWMPLNPAASLMRVMEVISSGILLEDGAGLKDPCEKEESDVTGLLSVQEKEDLTRSAQEYLRRMHFRQLYKVLGLPEEDPADEAGTEDN